MDEEHQLHFNICNFHKDEQKKNPPEIPNAPYFHPNLYGREGTAPLLLNVHTAS